MAREQETAAKPSKGRLLAINLIGVVGLVFGALPIIKYLLALEVFTIAAAPYEWLELEGGTRYLPPAVVLALCMVLAWWLEQRSTRD